MWVPMDDGFLAQENLARAPLATVAASVNASAAAAAGAALPLNATQAAAAAASTLTLGTDQELVAQIVVVALIALTWLILCGVCRFYVFCPCPCCFCYIPCCCGFCLKREPKRHANDHYVRHDVRYYPGGGKPQRRGHAEVPAYASHAVDMEEPLLSAPSYTHPPSYEASPPAYYDVPTAPPLS